VSREIVPVRDRARHFASRVRVWAQHWSTGRRGYAPAGLLALIAALAVSGLVAAADAPSTRAAAQTSHAKPKYLLPVGTLIRRQWLPEPTLTGDDGTVGVPPGTPRPRTTPAPDQGQLLPPLAAYRGANGTLTPAGIATLALRAGCAPGPAVVATAIAMAESGGSPGAQGDVALMDSTWDWSAGLWQIRGLRDERNTGGLRDSVANQAVAKNAAAMRVISLGCTDWTPWSTYNTGAYLQFMSLARQAVTYVVAWFNAHGHHYPPVPATDPNATIPSPGNGAGGPGAVAAGPAARSTSPRPRSNRQSPRSSAAAKPGGANPAPAASSPAAGPAPVGGGGVGGTGGGLTGGGGTGGGLLPPVSSTPVLPLPTLTTPSLPLPLPTLTLPKLAPAGS